MINIHQIISAAEHEDGIVFLRSILGDISERDIFLTLISILPNRVVLTFVREVYEKNDLNDYTSYSVMIEELLYQVQACKVILVNSDIDITVK